MKFNKYKKNLRDEFNNNYNKETDEYKIIKPETSKRKAVLKLLPLYIVAGLFLLIGLTLSITEGAIINHNKLMNDNMLKYSKNSYNDLELITKKEYNKYSNYVYWDTLEMPAIEMPSFSFGFGAPKKAESSPTGTSAAIPTDTSSSIDLKSSFDTNNQETGVIEGDKAKFDGKYCYYINQGMLSIFNLEGTRLVFQKIIFDEEYKNLYAKIQLSNQVYNNSQDQQIIIYSKYFLKIYKFDGTDIEKLYETNNNILDTRLFNNQFYYVESFYNGNNSKDDEVNWDMLYYDGISNCEYIYKMVRLNLNNIEDKTVVDLASGYNATLYMNQTNIIITNKSYICYSGDITLACMFDLELNSLGVFAIEGSINDQYSMDVYETYFRVVSTTDNRLNYLTIFDMESKKITAILGGIGKKYETVRSVSFTDDKCYVVTYVNTDPLYEIDITDPYNPKIIDSLEVPGYSSYMKTFEINGQTYIFGAGYSSNFNYKYSIFKDDENNYQIGNDYIIETYFADYYLDVVDYKESIYYTSFTYRRDMCIDPHAMFFFVDDEADILYFGAPVNSLKFTLYKIDVKDEEEPIKVYKEFDTNGETRIFLYENTWYLPQSTYLITDTF